MPRVGWRPMEEAPRCGTTIVARRVPEDYGTRGQRTYWCQATDGHEGWCLLHAEDDVLRWFPDEWHMLGATMRREPPRLRA
jgi:hypothetical protein